MKRKDFVIYTILVSASLPVAYYLKKHKWGAKKSIDYPEFLGSIFDDERINAFGIEYRKQVPSEDNKSTLTNLILTNTKGKKTNSSDKYEIQDLVSSKNVEDFKNGNVVIIGGWIISKTEARQCALFSIT